MKKKIYQGLLAAITLCLFVACSSNTKTIQQKPTFSSDSAYAYIEKQMSFGPRVPNSAAHSHCAVWLIQQLRACGAQVELQKGQMPDYRGNMQQIYNIVAHFSTPAIENRPRLLLAAHYDTRPWCDEEPNYDDRFYNVPGANDGASGVGVLLEVGRQIGMRMADSTLYTPVDIVLFDCEDMGTPQFYIGQEREDTWCLGSQLWSTDYAQQEQPAKYKYGILLDMVGAPDAVFPKEMYSTQYAQNYQEQIWRSAEQLGYGALFSQQQSYPITDDHYYVNVIAGIPCVDIIHYDTRNATGFASWWHTLQDDISNISKSTLQAVGEVVMSQVK